MPQKGLIERGNVDLFAQPSVSNPDGSHSTVDSRSFNFDGREVLLPSVTPDGRHLRTDNEIVAEYKKTGRHLGVFADVASANAYASQLHNDYAAGKYERTVSDQQPPAFDQVVPEFGGVGIPANMGPEERSRFNAAMTRKLKEEKPGAKQPPKTNWIDDAVKWLPSIGGAAVDLLPTAGGMIGGLAGASAGPLGVVGGAALGGASGEAIKQGVNKLRGVDPQRSIGDRALSVAKEGGIQGAIGGATAGVGALARGVAPTVMRTALGNTEAVLSRAPDVATTALKTGATVTRSGLHKLDDLLASKTLGLADQKAVEATRDAVAEAWKRLSVEQSKTLFGATAGNPAFRSLMAQGLYHVAAPIANVSAQGIRLLLGIANASEQR